MHLPAGVTAGLSFPNALTTGPVAGTTFATAGDGTGGTVSSGTGWSWYAPYQAVYISGANAIVENLIIPFPAAVDVFASGATIRNCLITTGGTTQNNFAIAIETDSNNSGAPIVGLTIQDCTITGEDPEVNPLTAGIKDIYGATTGLVIQRCNISVASTGIQVCSGLVQDCYIHDPCDPTPYGFHLNGITSGGGNGLGTPLIVRHNTILNPYGQTDAVGLFQDTSSQANVTIDGNLLAGGDYAIYGGWNNTGTYGATSGIVVTNNRISQAYYATGGVFGSHTAFNASGSGNVWSGNVYHDTNAPILVTDP